MNLNTNMLDIIKPPVDGEVHHAELDLGCSRPYRTAKIIPGLSHNMRMEHSAFIDGST